MAKVEIYKLKKTIDPEVREYGMFEFFGMVKGPLPQNYVREWAGELNSGNLETLCGRFMLNPPREYNGGPLEKSDVAVVNGEAYFLDRESGYKFVDVNFDTSDIKNAIHVDYGYYVNTDGAAALSRNLAVICDDLDIPIGYFSEPDYHGSHKGESSFDPSARDSYATAYLHPQFLKDAEAKDFIGLFTELSVTEKWPEIKEYLIENYPVYQQDLEKSREQFAPELLLPIELRPFSSIIPVDTDKSELAYLAANIKGMDSAQRNIFEAAVEAGWYRTSVAAMITLTLNIDCFKLNPDINARIYGEFRRERDLEECEEAVNRLENSEDLADQALCNYIMLLERCVEAETYGYHAAKEDGDILSSKGVITQWHYLKKVYNGVEDLPAEFAGLAEAVPINGSFLPDHSTEGNNTSQEEQPYFEMKQSDTRKPSVLRQIAETRSEQQMAKTKELKNPVHIKTKSKDHEI